MPSNAYTAPPLRQLLKHLSYLLLLPLRFLVSWRSEVTVLMYHAVERSAWKHAVSPEAFERQMRYLAFRGLAVPLEDVVAHSKGEKHLRRAVAVTFDDGYGDLLVTVLPILERYRIPVTVFVPSDLSAKTSPDARARLSGEELQKLAASPLIMVGSHSRTHRKFTELSRKEAEIEVWGSMEDLNRLTGVRPRFFAYPYGARNAAAEAVVAAAGYEAAFGITDGLVTDRSPRYALPRVQVDATTSPFLFRARLTRAVAWHRRLFRP